MSKQSLIDKFLAVLAEEEKEAVTAEATPLKEAERLESLARAREAGRNIREQQRKARQQMTINYIAQNGPAAAGVISKALNIPKSTMQKVLVSLRETGELVRSGEYFETVYMLGTGTPAPVKAVAPKPRKSTKSEQMAQYNEAILAYVSKHDGQRYTIYSMAKDLDIEAGKVYYAVDNLVRRGLLARGFNRGTEVDEPITESEVAAAEVAVVTTGENKEADPLYQKIEFLVWDYVKNTRSTDVLAFLTYLETKCK
jgi:predicted transcriptional regulator